MKHWKLLIPPFISLVIILGTSAVIIAYGRGYRPGFTQQDSSIVRSTGLLSVTSDPVGAQVYLDGVLQTATNNSFNVSPGKHTIRISKDGYLSWQKDILVEKEVVSRADAFLFPVNPSLSPLTSSGVIKPTLSPDGNQIAYIRPPLEQTEEALEQAGLWIYDLVDRPLGFNRDVRQIGIWQSNWDTEDLTIEWSPDSQEVLLTLPNQTTLYNLNNRDRAQIVTTELQEIRADWETQQKVKNTQQFAALKQPLIDIATRSAELIAFSPDETKLLYVATAAATIPQIITPPLIGANTVEQQRDIIPGNIYVYDIKEDKNFLLFQKDELAATPTPSPTGIRRIPTPTLKPELNINTPQLTTDYPIRWFPTNNHLVITLPGKIDILQYDRTNWITVYSGPFQEGFVAPWPTGSRLIIVTNLNPGASPLPNLYTVNLR